MLDKATRDYLRDFLTQEHSKQLSNLTDTDNILEIDVSGDQYLSDTIRGKGVLIGLEELAVDVAQNQGNMITRVRIKLFGLTQFNKIRKLKAKDIGKLVKIRGLVNRASEIRPMYISAAFKCRECGQLSPQYPQESSVLKPPTKCTSCKNRTFDVSDEDSDFRDSQQLRVQELPSDIPSGQTPRNIEILVLEEDIIQKARCGDLVEIIGVARVKAIQKRGTSSRFTRHYIEANNIEKKRKEPEAIEITEEDEVTIKELAKNPDVCQILTASVAPSLYGLEDIKEGCIYLLFGGVAKRTGNLKIRGNINILVVGDPSTGKSQILQAVVRVAPLALYTSGRGTTAAGLTAAVIRESSEHFTLEAGVMVLADKGIACIDEVDKMRAEDRVAMHEALEQQTVSIDKGDIHQTLNARTSVLAAGNPTMGKYDLYKTVKENLSNLPETFFSRFDLIFITKDYPERDSDARMSEHVLNIHRDVPEGVSIELIQKYISFAKRLKPKLTKEAKRMLNDYYVKVRGAITEGAIGITLRQLESLVRISEAHARIRLSEKATVEDVEAAIKLFSKSVEQVGIDQREGKSNKTVRGKMEIMLSVLCEETERNDLFIAMQRDHNVSPFDAGKVLNRLLEEGRVFETKSGFFKKV